MRFRSGEFSETAHAIVESNTKAVCELPPGLFESRVEVAISLNGGQVYSDKALRFDVYQHPQFKALRPRFGPAAGGTMVKIDLDRKVDFKPTGILVKWVSRFGNRVIAVTNGKLSFSRKHVETAAPRNANKNKNAEFLENIDLAVAFDGTSFVPVEEWFSYHSDVLISALSVRSGPVSGGTELTINALNKIDRDVISHALIKFSATVGKHVRNQTVRGTVHAVKTGMHIKCKTPIWPQNWVRVAPRTVTPVAVTPVRCSRSRALAPPPSPLTRSSTSGPSPKPTRRRARRRYWPPGSSS